MAAGSTPGRFMGAMKTHPLRWIKIAKAANIKPE